MAQPIERSSVVELLADAVQQHRFCAGSVVLDERFPCRWLRCLHPSNQIRRKESASAVIKNRVAFHMEPAIGGEITAYLVLKADFLVEAHAASALDGTRPRTSILPVAAAEIRALRRSCRSSMAAAASAVRMSILAVSPSRKVAMVDCSDCGGISRSVDAIACWSTVVMVVMVAFESKNAR